MKKLSMPLLLALLIINSSFKSEYNRVVIKYVSYEKMTVFDISCSTFDIYFRNQINQIEIKEKNVIDSLGYFINNLKKDKEGYIPDVRVKILLYNTNRVDSICMSKLGILFNGVPMQQSKKLIDYIEKLKLKSPIDSHRL